MKRLIAFLLVCVMLGAGVKASISWYMQKPLNTTSDIIFEVKRGDSFSKVAQELSDKKLIKYPRVFVKLAQFYGYSSQLKFGEYELKSGFTKKDVMEKLISGDTYKYSITFLEGDHFYKYATQIEEMRLDTAKNFLALIKDPKLIKSLLGEEQKTLEGYLFPDTYKFSKSDRAKTIVKTMVNRFLSATKNISWGKLGRHKAVTLASIIEKETGAGFERPIISSVFHNRLKKKMRLQTDPTIIYGIMDETGREISNIRKKDIRRPTKYNTYVIYGLPPGPIANPGIEAIKAAVNPKESNYLYFVSQNDGTHVFSKNYKDHLKAVKAYQLNPKARQGKSWRDLKNNKKVR